MLKLDLDADRLAPQNSLAHIFNLRSGRARNATGDVLTDQAFDRQAVLG
jgi:hypothetical protein